MARNQKKAPSNYITVLISQTDAGGNVTRYEYDSSGRLIRVIDPQGNASTSAYDANGNKTSETDANGNTTYFEYNYKGQLIKVTDALGNVTGYTYGGSGCSSCGGGGDNLTSITDANGNVTTYKYDSLGRVIKETDALGVSIIYSYDSKGNLKSKTDGNGSVILYEYDYPSRLIKKTYPDGSVEAFEYDRKGNLTYAGNRYIAYALAYDATGRVKSVTDSDGRVITYEYDVSGNKTKMTGPDGRAVAYQYEAGRLNKIISEAGTFNFAYDASGRRTKLSYPNGAYATYAYDGNGRLTSLAHKTSGGSVIDSFSYTHDKVGNRLSKAMPDRTMSYKYDRVYQLLEAMSSTPGWSANNKTKGSTNPLNNQKEAYSYDPVGNRLFGPDKNDLYSYNQGNQLVSSSDAQYEYDLNGNLIFKADESGTTSYSYDYENRLTRVIMPDGTASVYTYDPFGRRISKAVNGSATCYFYDNEDILFEYDASGVVGNKYVHGAGIDEPLAVIQNRATYYYHADGLGSITALTDSSAKAVQTYEYDSFGKLKDLKNRIKQPYTITGREFDRETGLYYYRARYYDAEVGRFTQKDPVGFKGGINHFVYVSNNPIKFTDPFGLRLCRINLNGLGQTYLDDAFSPMVRRWNNSNISRGIDLTFTEAFRTTAYQRELATNPNATTPAIAGNSLHECGFAVDISWNQLDCRQRDIAVQNARDAGISWGGNFTTPDRVHFYNDRGNRTQLIQQAQDEFHQGITYDCP